jgi:FixJ family two-component response regulator
MSPIDGPLVAIVDDDEPFRRSIERLVRSAGFSVASFGSAEDFLSSADWARTACAILDVKLPGMNGLDLQQHISTKSTPMVVVFVSANDADITRAKAMHAGAIAFLKKPFDNSTLLEALSRALT